MGRFILVSLVITLCFLELSQASAVHLMNLHNNYRRSRGLRRFAVLYFACVALCGRDNIAMLRVLSCFGCFACSFLRKKGLRPFPSLQCNPAIMREAQHWANVQQSQNRCVGVRVAAISCC